MLDGAVRGEANTRVRIGDAIVNLRVGWPTGGNSTFCGFELFVRVLSFGVTIIEGECSADVVRGPNGVCSFLLGSLK